MAVQGWEKPVYSRVFFFLCLLDLRNVSNQKNRKVLNGKRIS